MQTDIAHQALMAAFVTTESKSLLCSIEGKIIALSDSLLNYSQCQQQDLLGHDLIIASEPDGQAQDWRQKTKRQYRQTHLTGYARVSSFTEIFRDLSQITIRPLGKPDQLLGYKVTFERASDFDRSLPITAWQNLFSDNQEALCLFDASLNILSASKRLQELIGRPLIGAEKLDQLVTVTPSFNEWFFNAKQLSTQAALTTDQGQLTISLSVSTIELNERPLFLASMHDISPYLARVESTQHHAQKFRDLLENNRLGIAFVTKKGIYQEANERFAEILGVDVSTITGKHYSHFNTSDSYDLTQSGAQQLVSTGYCDPIDKQLRHADGSSRRVRIQLLGQFDDQARFIGTWNFIHYTEDSSEAQNLTHHYEALFASSPDAIALISPEGVYQRVNDAFCQLTGYTSQQLVGQTALLHSDPDARLREQTIFHKQLFERGLSERYEKNLIHANGTLTPVSTQNFLIRADNGKAIGYWSVSRDASSRHDLIQTLADSELRFRSLFSNSIDAIAFCLKEGSIQYANKAFVELSGYSQSELRSLSIRELTPSNWHHVDHQINDQLTQRGYTDIFEKEMRTKFGVSVPVSVRASRMRDSQNENEGSWMIIRDIREFKTTLRKLQHSQNILEQTSQMSRVGGWELNIQDRHFNLTSESYRILSISESYHTSVRNVAKLLADQSSEQVSAVVKDVIRDQSRREIELKLSGFQPERWIRVSAQYNKKQDRNFVYGAIQDISDFKIQQQRLESDRDEYQRQALHDPLTDLPNRALLQDRTLQIVSQAQRQGLLSCLIILDLDGFKAINDQYGHPAGDKLLKSIAQRLLQIVRTSDTVSRLGGDEFVVVALLQDATQAEALADKLLHTVRQPINLDDVSVSVGCSIGISLSGDPATTTFDYLYATADAELYKVKAAGKGAYGIAINASEGSQPSYFSD